MLAVQVDEFVRQTHTTAFTKQQQIATETDLRVQSTHRAANVAWFAHAAALYQMQRGNKSAFQKADPQFPHLGYETWGEYLHARGLTKTWSTYLIAAHKYYVDWLGFQPEQQVNKQNQTLADVGFEKLYIMRKVVRPGTVMEWLNRALEMTVSALAYEVGLALGTISDEPDEETGDDGFLDSYEEDIQAADLVEVLHRVRRKFPPTATLRVNITRLNSFDLARGSE